MNKAFYILILLTLGLTSCEKTIDLNLPEEEPLIVIDGSIEVGQPPLVFVTRSLNYFEPFSLEYFAETIINDAEVKMVNNGDTVLLQPLCSASLPDSLRPLVGELIGLPISDEFDICVYTDLTFSNLGAPGNSYELLVNARGNSLKSITTIPEPILLDSLEFRVNGERDSLGFVYAFFSEPATPGNCYRWWGQRINTYKHGELKGQIKDFDYIAPFNSVFNDELVNGREFEFGYNRGVRPGSQKEDDQNVERGYYKVGDTINIKFATIDKDVYQYYRTFYLNLSNSGSPFATPTDVITNIEGGLGVWAGYGTSFYTVIAAKDNE